MTEKSLWDQLSRKNIAVENKTANLSDEEAERWRQHLLELE
jgi:hypothetical protein